MEELKLKKEIAEILSLHLSKYYEIMSNIVSRVDE